MKYQILPTGQLYQEQFVDGVRNTDVLAWRRPCEFQDKSACSRSHEWSVHYTSQQQ